MDPDPHSGPATERRENSWWITTCDKVRFFFRKSLGFLLRCQVDLILS